MGFVRRLNSCVGKKANIPITQTGVFSFRPNCLAISFHAYSEVVNAFALFLCTSILVAFTLPLKGPFNGHILPN